MFVAKWRDVHEINPLLKDRGTAQGLAQSA